MSTRLTLTDRIATERIRMAEPRFVGTSTERGWTRNTWRVTVRYRGRRYTYDFHMGTAWQNGPSLHMIVSDMIFNVREFEQERYETADLRRHVARVHRLFGSTLVGVLTDPELTDVDH